MVRIEPVSDSYFTELPLVVVVLRLKASEIHVIYYVGIIVSVSNEMGIICSKRYGNIERHQVRWNLRLYV